MDEPLIITAAVDGRDSDFFILPARPKYDLVLSQAYRSYGPIRRSSHYGPEAASARFCLPSPDGSSQYLPETVTATATGNGLEWEGRSRIEIKQKTPLDVCAVVYSAGVPCKEESCYHDTTGHLSAVLASLVKIEY